MEKIPAFHLFFIDDGDKIIRPEEPLQTVKIGWRHTDDGERMSAQTNRLANHCWIRVEFPSPKSVAQHHVGSRARAVLIARVKKSSYLRLHAKQIEIVPGDIETGDFFHLVFPFETDARHPIHAAIPAKVVFLCRKSSNAG